MRIVRSFGRMGGLATVAAAVMATLALSACGSTKLMGKSLPDETQVIDGPTLAMPPQFDLRPPRQAADYETMLRAQKGIEAQNLILTGTSTTTVVSSTALVTPESVTSSTTTTNATTSATTVTETTAAPAAAAVPADDAWLVNKSAAQTGVAADPDVRQSLENKYPEDLKAEQEAKAKKGWLARMFSWGSSDE